MRPKYALARVKYEPSATRLRKREKTTHPFETYFIRVLRTLVAPVDNSKRRLLSRQGAGGGAEPFEVEDSIPGGLRADDFQRRRPSGLVSCGSFPFGSRRHSRCLGRWCGQRGDGWDLVAHRVRVVSLPESHVDDFHETRRAELVGKVPVRRRGGTEICVGVSHRSADDASKTRAAGCHAWTMRGCIR